ncbi:HIT family protein [Candidatus Kaiserbacteria bacterium]|nr:HIT family protein [Candidatus Kaiserbacteria bacterium]
MEKTLYEKLIDRDLPVWPVYEDDTAFAFLDIEPTNKGHALVIPKKPYRNIFDIPHDVLGHLMGVAQKISHAMRETLEADGITIVMNNESAGGQKVFHTHIHIIPRFEGDEIFQDPKHTEYKDGEKDALAEKLRDAIS